MYVNNIVRSNLSFNVRVHSTWHENLTIALHIQILPTNPHVGKGSIIRPVM